MREGEAGGRSPRFWQRPVAQAADAGMIAALNVVQARRWREASRPEEITRYLQAHGEQSLEEFYAVPLQAEAPVLPPADVPPRRDALGLPVPCLVQWKSPHPSGYAANDTARARFYPVRAGWTDAPTVFFLHALMSASDLGYRRWAATFHAQGWNACFVELPFHYGRRPAGFFNGELTISSNLVRTSETLRQGVMELRQLRAALSRVGSKETGLWATSYGGWLGALWSLVEADFRFVTLIQPIVDVEEIIWRSPAGAMVRRQARARGVRREDAALQKLYRLGNPVEHQPRGDAGRVLIVAGEYDRVVAPGSLRELHRQWAGSRWLHGAQGHFGYRLMREAFARLEADRDLLV